MAAPDAQAASVELGRIRRDEGVAQADDHAVTSWRDAVDAVIRDLAASGRRFSADTVAELVPAPWHPPAVGARFLAAIRAGVIVPVDYAVSYRASRHRGLLRVYRGAGDDR